MITAPPTLEGLGLAALDGRRELGTEGPAWLRRWDHHLPPSQP